MSGTLQCAALFEPADPPRNGHVVFWHPDGLPPESTEFPASAVPGRITVVRGGPDGSEADDIPCLRVPVMDAVPLLARARTTGAGHPAAAGWGAVALFGLHLIARGRLAPSLTPSGIDAWTTGPLDPADEEILDQLAAALPAEAHAAPVGNDPGLLCEPRHLITAFLDALADAYPRTPAAGALGGPGWSATPDPHHLPQLRTWADSPLAGTGEVRLTLKVDLEQLTPASRRACTRRSSANPARGRGCGPEGRSGG
ncbi:hypothetical protein ACWEV4_32575 [Streptomyces sp. NPDC003860]